MKGFACLLIALCLSCTAFAQIPDCVTYGDLPAALGSCSLDPFLGAPTAVALDSEHLLVNGAAELDVYAVADGPVPQLVGSLQGLESVVARGMPAVVGTFAYLANENGAIVDLSDPTEPVVAGELGPGVRDLAARGNLLAAAISDYPEQYTQLLDATAPLAPVPLGTVPVLGRPIFLGDWLAVMADGIWIYDIADPAAPVLLTHIQYETSSGGNEPYNWYDTTRVLDAELLPDALILLTNHYHQFGSWIYGNVEITNTIARRRIDLADLSAPVETASTEVRRTDDINLFLDYNLTRAGELMLEGREFFDPWSEDLATIAALPALAPVPGGVVDLGDGRAFVCSNQDLAIVPLELPPVANIAAPLDLPNQPSAGCAAIGIGGGFLAYLSSGYDDYGYGWTDLSIHEGPGQPAVTTESWYDWSTSAMDAAGGLLAVGNLLFHVGLDLTLTEYPLDLGYDVARLSMPDPQRLAAVTSTDVLSLHDVSDPANAVRLGELSLPSGLGYPLALDWQDDRILVGGSGGLAIVRVEAGLQPVFAGELDLQDVRHLAWLSGDEILAVAGDQLLRIDISAPAAPQVTVARHAGILEGPLLVQGDLAYATADGLLSLFDASTLEPLGTLALDHAIAALARWNGELVGAARDVRGFAYLPPACELEVTGAPETPAATVRLLDVRPNPFNPLTTVRFALASGQRLDLAAYDLQGRRVRRLAGGVWPAGEHQVRWDGRGEDGAALPAGVYLLRLETAAGVATGKAVLVK